MATISPKSFIQQVFLSELREIVYEHGYHYLSFALICSGIEFLGKAADPEAIWRTYRAGGYHFKLALKKLMPGYGNHSNLLYKSLRCSFAHGLIPGPPVGLTHRQESKKYATKHLHVSKGGFVIVVEDFYDDF